MCRFASSLLCAAFAVLAACSDDAVTGPSDAAAPDARPDTAVVDPNAPQAPRIDWLADGAPAIAEALAPTLTPCPAGWRAFEVAGVEVCDPFPASGPLTCAPHEAHFPGDAACARVGSACAADGWPSALPGAGVVYVRAGASGGDGSRGSPFGRIADALDAGADTIALAVGRYDEAVSLGADTALLGACAEATILGDTLTLAGDGASLSDVTIEAASPALRATATATAAGVIVDGAAGNGVVVAAGALSLREVLVRAVDRSGGPGHGLFVGASAAATVERAVFERPAGDGVSVDGAGARADLADVAIREAGGNGVSVTTAASATIDRTSIAGSARAGLSNAAAETAVSDSLITGAAAPPTSREHQGIVLSSGRVTLSRVALLESGWAGIDMYGGELDATDLVVADTEPIEDEARSGYGITATRGTISIERAHFSRNSSCAISLSAETIRLTDVTAVDTRESAPAEGRVSWGCGLQVSSPDAELSRIRVDGNVRSGITVYGEDTNAHLEDVWISDTVGSASDSKGGEGFYVVLGATAVAERVLIERCQFAGLGVRDAAALEVTDLVSRDISAPNDFGISGFGVRIEAAGEATVHRALIERAGLAGIHVVEDGSAIVATDLVVRDMLGEERFGLHGWGLGATNGGRAELTRARFTRPRYVGLVTSGSTSRLTATDLVLEDTLEARCADDLCAGAPFGIGLGAYSGGVVDIRRFLITRSHVIGVQLAGEGTIDLAEGEVSMSPVGANVQADAFPIERLTEGVSYRENEQNLVTEALPVPSVGGVE